MRQTHWLLFACVLVGTAHVNGQSKLSSVYTDLVASKCKTIEVDKETGGSVQRCPGIAGYKLLVLDDDARQSVTVVSPSGKQHALDYWQVITGHFSSVGNKAEWRVARKAGKITPVALIVRVNANEHTDNPNRITSYLAVAKITPEAVCVTHKIAPGVRANENARRAADGAQSAPCLKGVVQ